MAEKRPARRRIFAGIAVVAGLALLALELVNPKGTTSSERWFWFIVGVLLIGLGLAELMSRRETNRSGELDDMGPLDQS